MIGPKEVRERALKWWPEVLRAALTKEDLFPRALPRIGKVTAVKTPEDAARVAAEHAALLPGDGKHYVLEWRAVTTRRFGEQRFVDRIVIPDLRAYLRLTGKELEYGDFLGAERMIRSDQPALKGWLRNNVLDVLTYSDQWPYLLMVVDYFRHRHVRDRYYVRELPIPVPTKFIETHRVVLTSLLEALGLGLTAEERAARGVGMGVRDFARRYGVRTIQPLVRVRLLGGKRGPLEVSSPAAPSPSGGWGARAAGNNAPPLKLDRIPWEELRDISLPLDDFARLAPPAKRIIVLENKASFANLETFLTLPDLEDTAAIFGSGFRAGLLSEATWLHDVELLYWGDLDAHGLQIVNQLRGYFPHLRTLLMDRRTLDIHRDYWVEAAPSTAVELPHLTEGELALYDYLNDGRIRLEQERIGVAAVRAAFIDYHPNTPPPAPPFLTPTPAPTPPPPPPK